MITTKEYSTQIISENVKVLDVEFQCDGVIHHTSRNDVTVLYAVYVGNNMVNLEDVLKPEVIGAIKRVLLQRYGRCNNGSV